jgi:hypothetical protein
MAHPKESGSNETPFAKRGKRIPMYWRVYSSFPETFFSLFHLLSPGTPIAASQEEPIIFEKGVSYGNKHLKTMVGHWRTPLWSAGKQRVRYRAAAGHNSLAIRILDDEQ